MVYCYQQMPTYKKNFVHEAIIRIVFDSPAETLTSSIPDSINDTALRSFPLREVRPVHNEELLLNRETGEFKTKRTDSNEYNYYANDKQKRLCITKDFIFVTYSKYLNWDDLSTPFMTAARTVCGEVPDVTVKRVGLRYINHVNPPGTDPFEWNEYLDHNLLASFKVPEHRGQVIRSIQVLELQNPDLDTRMKVQYGMHNPDYPGPIKKKLFILDFDAYKIGSLDFEDIETAIPLLHDEIEKCFEQCIKNPLRELMNV